jgi:putative SOS response-associated peptidase YedK
VVCSRYTNTLGPDEIGRQLAGPLGVQLRDSAGTGRYNIAPTEPVLAIAAPDGKPETELLRFGLLPGWAKQLKDGNKLINARVEGLQKTGKFANVPADPAHRALMLADGWIEWRHPEDKKLKPEPIRFTVDDGRAFAFAALRATNRRISDEPILSCAMLTCDPNANRVASAIHNRMPVVLSDVAQMRAWLDPQLAAEDALSMCEALPANRTSVKPMNPAVNEPGGEDAPWLLDPPPTVPADGLATPDGQTRLFAESGH